MVDIDTLRWTSRGEVAACLLGLAQDPEADPNDRLTAIHLLASLAQPAQAQQLCELMRAPDRRAGLVAEGSGDAARVRACLIVAFAQTGAPVPREALDDLLADPSLVSEGAPANGLPELEALIELMGAPEPQRHVIRWLKRQSHEVRAEVLLRWTGQSSGQEVCAWLRDEWLSRSGDGTSDARNRLLALSVFHDRPEAISVLRRFWKHRRHQLLDAPGFVDDLRRFPALLELAPFPWGLDLVRPLPELLAARGPEGLAREVHRIIEHQSRYGRWLAGYPLALELLSRWEQGALHHVPRWLQGAPLSQRVRRDLVGLLFERLRPLALDLVRARLGDEEDLPTLRRVVQRVADERPRVSDRDFLRAALSVRDEAVRCSALRALDLIHGDDGGWHARLRALTRAAEPLVRVWAAFALARRGEREHEQALAASARREPRVEVRAEAISLLGQLPSAHEHVPLFEEALIQGCAQAAGAGAPITAESSRALARSRGERALTALLRGAFLGDLELATKIGVYLRRG